MSLAEPGAALLDRVAKLLFPSFLVAAAPGCHLNCSPNISVLAIATDGLTALWRGSPTTTPTLHGAALSNAIFHVVQTSPRRL